MFQSRLGKVKIILIFTWMDLNLYVISCVWNSFLEQSTCLDSICYLVLNVHDFQTYLTAKDCILAV